MIKDKTHATPVLGLSHSSRGGINMSFISGDKGSLIVTLSSSNDAAGNGHTQAELSALSKHPDNSKTQQTMYRANGP